MNENEACMKCGGRMYSERSIERGVCLSCEDFDYAEEAVDVAELGEIDVVLGGERE